MLCLQNVGFIRMLTKVQTARFKMRRDSIMLVEDMYLFLMDLPDEYDYGLYAKFINLYGTHYMTSGTMGGIFEYILVVDKDEMKRKREHVLFISISNCKIVCMNEINHRSRPSTNKIENSIYGFDLIYIWRTLHN